MGLREVFKLLQFIFLAIALSNGEVQISPSSFINDVLEKRQEEMEQIAEDARVLNKL